MLVPTDTPCGKDICSGIDALAMENYDSYGTISGAYQYESFQDVDGTVRTEVYDSSMHIAASIILKAVKSILSTNGKVLATVYYKKYGSRFELVANKRATQVIQAMRLSPYEYGYDESKVVMRLSPYITEFIEALDKIRYDFMFFSTKEEQAESLEMMNDFVSSLYLRYRSADFRRIERNQRRASNKNARGTSDYVNELTKQFARLIVLRVDLSYTKSTDASISDEFQSTVFHPKIVDHRVALFKQLSKSGSPFHMAGYICKLEYAPRTGFHYHVMLFLDGSKVKDHVALGRHLGELWQGKITSGAGRYWNCIKQPWAKAEGVGRLDYYNKSKLAQVKHAAEYLIKVDRWVRAYIGEGRRNFFKGVVKVGNSKGGRPRSKTPVPAK